MLGMSEARIVKKAQADAVGPASSAHSPSGTFTDQDVHLSQTDDRQSKRIMWTREQMLSIAPECRSLPEGLGVIPEDMASLFDVRHPASVRPRGKGRVGLSLDTGGRKRAEDPVRNGEMSTSAWRKKDRAIGTSSETTERNGGQGRAGAADTAWRNRRETHDDGIWNASPSAAGVNDGWLMPDTDEVYELGGDNNNVEAFEAMRQQARAEWAQAGDLKPVQDSATEDLMNNLMAEARDDAATTIGAPPGLSEVATSPEVQGAMGAPHKIDVQSLFNGIPAVPPGLNSPIRPQSVIRDTAKQGTVAFRPPESDMRSILPAVPVISSGASVAPESKPGMMEAPLGTISEVGQDQATEDLSLLSSGQPSRAVDVGSLFDDGGIDDAASGLPLEDMCVSQEVPRTSSPPSSSPKGSIWGPGLDTGAMGSTITSTDWTQMQEIWKREPASVSQEAASGRHISDGFSREQLTGSISNPAAGMNHPHVLLSDGRAYGRRPNNIDVPAYATAQGQQHVSVSDPMLALASMSLLPMQSTGADKQIHHDSRQLQPSVASHGAQAQPNYGTVNMARRQPQQVHQRQAGHMVPQPQGASEDPHSFEIYLKQLVANAQQQQQQQQVSEQQRVQAAVGPRATHASSVMHPRGQPYSQAAVTNQQASMEQIRKLAPALQLASAAIPQQRQVGPMPTARQLQPQASNSYSNVPQGHRMQDPSWMLRQLKGTGHPQAHAGSSNPALQQPWATPMQVQYPASTYDRRGQQAAMQQYGAAAHTARSGLQQTHAALQGLYADRIARAALQSSRQPQQQAVWLPQSTSQGSVYPTQVRPAHVQGLQQAMNRGGQYSVQSSLPRYYPDNTQPGYTTLYRQ